MGASLAGFFRALIGNQYSSRRSRMARVGDMVANLAECRVPVVKNLALSTFFIDILSILSNSLVLVYSLYAIVLYLQFICNIPRYPPSEPVDCPPKEKK